MNLKTLISTTALAISANTFAVDLASKNTDSYQHISNATGRLNYAGKTFLIDPMLAEKGRYAGFEGTTPVLQSRRDCEDYSGNTGEEWGIR